MVSGEARSHPEPARRLLGVSVPAGAPGLIAGLASLGSVIAILATVVRLVAWRMDLHYVEPWYDSQPEEKHYLYYGSFIDRQLLWTGLPLIATNVVALAALWASFRWRNRSA